MPTRRRESVIRSGRFKVNTANTTISLVGKRTGAYRILNAGKKEFTLNVLGASGSALKVGPGQSIDFYLKNQALDVTTSNDVIEHAGIYDELRPNSDARSGRFTFLDATALQQHSIVDVKARNAGNLMAYRIYNSGEKDFTVFGKDTNSTLSPGNSMDVECTNQGVIAVQPANLNETITGIYEFLGLSDV